MAESLELPVTLVLGAGGYIGKTLINYNQNKTRLIPVHHSIPFDFQKHQQKVSTIINLSASSFSSDAAQSWKSNYNYQKEILSLFASNKIKWVQVASYYELQIPYGRSDFYSKTKLEFRKYLMEYTVQHPNVEITSLVLPHVFGGDETSNRLIPTVRKMISGDKVSFGSPHQIIPLLHVQDVAEALIQAVFSRQMLCTPKPIWNGTLKSLLNEILPKGIIPDLTLFSDYSEGHMIQTIEFPEHLKGFEPMYKLSDLIDELRVGR